METRLLFFQMTTHLKYYFYKTINQYILGKQLVNIYYNTTAQLLQLLRKKYKGTERCVHLERHPKHLQLIAD